MSTLVALPARKSSMFILFLAPVVARNHFSHVKYSFIKMRNVFRVGENIIFMYASYFFLLLFLLLMFTVHSMAVSFHLCVEKCFHFGVCTISFEQAAQRDPKSTINLHKSKSRFKSAQVERTTWLGESEPMWLACTKHSRSRDGMKGPICFDIFFSDTRFVVAFQHLK